MQEPSPQLLARCRQGDTKAYSELVAQVQPYVYNLAYRLLGNVDEAQDLAQDALVRAWQTLASFRGEARFTTWLYRLVVNLGLNRRAHLRREMAHVSMDTLPQAEVSAAEPEPAAKHTLDEQKAFIWAQVEKLPAHYRVVLTLYYQQERSYNEIASILSLPLNTVKTHLARARHILATRLADLREGPDAV
jgi:RNA polymerase sigma-70 factor (ECF subfamily)